MRSIEGKEGKLFLNSKKSTCAPFPGERYRVTSRHELWLCVTCLFFLYLPLSRNAPIHTQVTRKEGGTSREDEARRKKQQVMEKGRGSRVYANIRGTEKVLERIVYIRNIVRDVQHGSS